MKITNLIYKSSCNDINFSITTLLVLILVKSYYLGFSTNFGAETNTKLPIRDCCRLEIYVFMEEPDRIYMYL